MPPGSIAIDLGGGASVAISFARDGRTGWIAQRRSRGWCVLLRGAFVRGAMLVDRDGSRRFRVIDAAGGWHDLTRETDGFGWQSATGTLLLRSAGDRCHIVDREMLTAPRG